MTNTSRITPWSLFALLVVTAGVLSCGGGSTLVTHETINRNNKVLYTTNAGYQLTLPELYGMLEESRVLPKGGILSAERLQSFVDSVLVDTLLGLKAPQVQLDKYFDFYRIYRIRYLDLLTRTYFDKQIGTSATVDSQTIADYYHAHPEQFTLPEQVLASTILITPLHLVNGKDSLVYRPLSADKRMEKAYEYALFVRSQITSPEKFPEVARTYSHAADADVTGGELGWVTRGVYLDPFDSVTFSLDSGEVSMPYRDKDGWHIMMVTEKVTAGLQPMEGEFYIQAARSAQMERVNTLGGKLIDSLKADIRIAYNDALLDADVFVVDPATWFATVNEADSIFVDDLRAYEDGYRNRYHVERSTPEMKKEMAQQIAMRARIVQETRKLGYDTLPDIARDRVFFMHLNQKQVLRLAFEPPLVEPTPEQITAYYNAHIDEFMTDKPYVVQHIIAPDSAFGLFLRDQALSGVDFLELAQQHYPGDPSVRVALADMGAIGEKDVSPEFWHAVTTTPVGEVSYPVKTANGYEVVKVVKRFDIRSVESYSVEIGMRVKEQLAQEHIARQRQSLFTEFGLKAAGPLPQIHLRPRDQRITE